MHLNRRDFLIAGTSALASGRQTAVLAEPAPARRPKIAAVVTEYRKASHADVIATKFLEGCTVLDVDWKPAVDVVSFYTDQVPANDLSRELARKHRVPIFDTVEGALTLGTGKLAVDGVLIIGEHGNYPLNEKGQRLYPRRRLFEETAAVIRKAGRPVPVYNDKHLAYNWADAKWMYDTARELKIPMMAGSSMPVTWRRPPLDLPLGSPLTEVLGFGYGGLESYGFHALEVMQCFAERRKGGETGVRSVQCLSGDAVWQAGDAGRWSWDLLRAALATSPEAKPGDPRALSRNPHVFLIEYRDGTKGQVLMLDRITEDFLFAGRLSGRAAPVATRPYGTGAPEYGHFAKLGMAIETMFLTGKPAYPVERTLLTTGLIDAAMTSRHEGGKRIETPWLDVHYRPAS